MSRPSEARRGDPIGLRSEALAQFFAGVMRRQMRRSFRAVRLARPGLPDLPEGRPLVVYANHPSWWDPAFFIVLAAGPLAARQSYGVIDAEMLEKYRFMGRIGLFGVERDARRGGVEFLRVAGRVLSDPARMLWITAQGEFNDPRQRPVTLRTGLARLMIRHPDIVALPLAVEYPFWTEKRPEALARFGEPVLLRDGESAEALNDRLAAGLEASMDALSAMARNRSPAEFERILSGTAGVGGVYGVWGRLKAAATGRRYVAEHMEEN
ncbi:1-acyl-sn-glycerol-3-phosphate acyltransferase [Palleronia aestuarii]|uniref:1-acyl-sn-glycerol-3-phosphate acyltransferase n=1 Tax=Palleronia aestuarii TaxID=568105 RepID=A0A2W7P0S4_9RHOB|nr:lysophospholipid acyltransferase family protein [Palleronia aestuarii]PZX17052.1 1-acyl-sn-glycerol-3-phosphate acyltransferase [Palleronia aestuarii]